MSRIVRLHDRSLIAATLTADPAMHVYAIGDLDDFFFPHTAWFALERQGRIDHIALLYTATSLPVLLAISPRDEAGMRELVALMRPSLPPRFYMHATEGVATALSGDHRLTPHGLHHKMALTRPERLESFDTRGAERLSPGDRAEIERFYQHAYPDNWFDPRMLETGCYFGARVEGRLAAVAGVHVVSRAYRAAALGNVATAPGLRGRGLGALVTAALCSELRGACDTIGLNVSADNAGAIRLYRRLGFDLIGSYEELDVTALAPGEGR